MTGETTIYVCSECGRMDFSAVGIDGHWMNGARCGGNVVATTYVPASARRWIEPGSAALKEPLPERDAAIMRASGPVDFQWTEGTAPRPSIALDDLGGPAETMDAAGLTNRGSLDWAMKHRGFPSPVKVLQRVRIWDLQAVKAWKDAQDQD